MGDEEDDEKINYNLGDRKINQCLYISPSAAAALQC